MMKVERFISAFEKIDDDKFVRIDFIRVPSPNVLRDILRLRPEELLYEEIELEVAHLSKLRPYVKNDFDLDNYDYFLSCQRVKLDGTHTPTDPTE